MKYPKNVAGPTKSRKKLIFIVVLLAVIAYGAYAYWPASHALGGGPQGGAAPVSVAEVIEREVQQWHEFSGRLVAVNQVEVRPRVSGTIMSVHFKDGAMVKKNELLFVIDPRPFEAALESARAKANFAEAEFKRAHSLYKEKAIPQRDFDQRKNDMAVARADLDNAWLNLEYTQIKSPIAGRVSRAEITVGNLVEASGNAPLLTTVVSENPIYADFEIDEDSFLHFVTTEGTGTNEVTQIPVMMGLASETGAPHEGHIQSFDNRLNTASGTIRVRATFENAKGSLLPGLFARIWLGNATKSQSILITDRAVGTDQSKKFVYVVGGDNKVEYREVKLGPLSDGLRVVQEGLKPGEKIIVNGLQRAHPGAPVTPEVVPMEDKAADSVNPASGKAPEAKTATKP